MRADELPPSFHPFDEKLYSFFDRDCRCVTKKRFGFADICVGLGHVAGLCGVTLNDGLFSESLL